MQPAHAVPGTSAAAHPLQSQPAAPSSGNSAGMPQPLLYQACRDGDTATLKRLLAAGGIAVNAIDPETRLAPLMLAARHGHDDVALLLMKGQQGASVNLQNSRGDTALSLAAGAGKDDVAELLLLKKAQPDQANHGGRTPLAEAAAGGHLKTAELLIANGAQVNAGAGSGEPALVAAAQRGHGALVELLLERKASLDAADRYGWTAFNHAASMGHAALAQRLRGDGASAGQTSNTAQQAPTASAPPRPAAVLPTATPAVNVDDGAAAPQALTRTTAITDTTTTTTTTTVTATTVTSIVVTQPAYAAPAAPAMPAMPAGAAMESLAALRKAVEGNDVEALNRIVTAHPDQPAMLNQSIAFARQRGFLPAGAYTLLMLAAARGHAHIVTALLAAGADVNAKGSAGKTALMLAVECRQIDAVEALLKAGAEVDVQAADGSTAVMQALARRDPHTVRALLAGVSNPEDISSCLRQAAASGYVNTVRLLIKAGADVNGFDDVKGYEHLSQYSGKDNLNPFDLSEWADSLALTRAVRNGHDSIVRILLDAGAKVNRKGYCKRLMNDAVKKGHTEVALMLLEARRMAPEVKPRDDSTESDVKDVMEAAIYGKNLVLVRSLLKLREGFRAARDEHRLLTVVVQSGDAAMLKAFLDVGASPGQHVNRTDPLMNDAARYASVEMITMLLDAGAKLDAGTRSFDFLKNSGATPLVVAAASNSLDVVDLLLARTADDPNRKNQINDALAAAATGGVDIYSRSDPVTNMRVKVVQRLLQAGADPNHNNGTDKMPLYLAADARQDKEEESADAASWRPPTYHHSAAIVRLLLACKAEVNPDLGNKTLYPSPLFPAARMAKAEVVRLLLEAGAKRDLKDYYGKTPLQYVQENLRSMQERHAKRALEEAHCIDSTQAQKDRWNQDKIEYDARMRQFKEIETLLLDCHPASS